MSIIQSTQQYVMRKMSEEDIPQLLELDQEAFPLQWPRPTVNSIRQELRNKLAHYLVICDMNNCVPKKQETVHSNFFESAAIFFRTLGSVLLNGKNKAQKSSRILAMAGIWMMVDEAHVITISVRQAERRKGLASWLLVCIIEMALELKAKIVTLEVRVSNISAQKLYEKFGFVRVGMRKKYYTDNSEDALVMTTDLLTTPAVQERFQCLKQELERNWGYKIH